MIKKILSIIMAFFVIQSPIYALTTPKQDDSIYVNDFSNVLSEDTKKELISLNSESDYESGGYVVVATFDFVDEDLYDFSYRLFNDWGIGSSEYNNGILLVLDIGNDNYCYILGSGIESILSDAEAWDIIDTYMEPSFAKKDYNQAVLLTTKQFLKVIEEGNYYFDDEDDNQETLAFTLLGFLGTILLFGFRIAITLLIIYCIYIFLRNIFRGNRRRRMNPMMRPTYRRREPMGRFNPMGPPPINRP
ncbi:MAG: TPM domain-containing protein, partial [Traorella sp.]